MTQRQARRWYIRARRAFPSLPPWSEVRVGFARLHRAWAEVDYETKGGRVRHPRIRINRDLRRKGNGKLAFREFAHEIAHLLRPRLDHGAAFERVIVRLKVAMEPDPTWY